MNKKIPVGPILDLQEVSKATGPGLQGNFTSNSCYKCTKITHYSNDQPYYYESISQTCFYLRALSHF